MRGATLSQQNAILGKTVREHQTCSRAVGKIATRGSLLSAYDPLSSVSLAMRSCGSFGLRNAVRKLAVFLRQLRREGAWSSFDHVFTSVCAPDGPRARG